MLYDPNLDSLYVADNCAIRLVNVASVDVTTVAGGGDGLFQCGDDILSTGVSAKFGTITAMQFSSDDQGVIDYNLIYFTVEDANVIDGWTVYGVRMLVWDVTTRCALQFTSRTHFGRWCFLSRG
jgi:hypothetical protein